MFDTAEKEMPVPAAKATDSMQRLTQACCAMNRLQSLKDVLHNITEEARLLIGAHQAKTRMVLGENAGRIMQAVALSEKYAAWRAQDMLPSVGAELDRLVCRSNQPMRLPHEELMLHPVWEPWNHATTKQPPMRGWLAAPLISADGQNFGLIQLTDRFHGEFTPEDEALLIPFCRMASRALENAWQHQALQVANQTLLQRLRSAMLHLEISETLIKGAEPTQALQACVEALVHHLGVACGQIWAVRGETLQLLTHTGPSMPSELMTIPLNQGHSLLGRVTINQRPWMTNTLPADAQRRERNWGVREGLTAFAGCPLMIDDRLEGVLAIYDRKSLPSTSLDALATTGRTISHWVKGDRTDAMARRPASSIAQDDLDANRPQHGLALLSADGIIMDWNAGAEAMLGHLPGDVTGQPIAMLFPPMAAHESLDMAACVARGEEFAARKSMCLHKNASLVEVAWSLFPLRGQDGKRSGAVLVFSDRSESRRWQFQCEQSQMSATLGKLAGGVLHDFNNLLTVILGYSEILQRSCEAGDNRRNLVGEIHKAGKRAESLVRQLLAFNVKKQSEPTLVDLGAIMVETEKMLRRLSGEDIELTTACLANVCRIRADALQMQQLILNLAVHARHAMPAGGKLTLQLANTKCASTNGAHPRNGKHPEPDRGYRFDASAPEKDFALLSVRFSSGPAKNRMRPFLGSCSTGDPQHGADSELAAVRSIVNANAGRMEMDDDGDAETAFHIVFPRAEQTAPAASEPTPIPRGDETLLLVEDEEVVRALTSHILRSCGYTVLAAKDGEEALWLGVNHTGPIDMLVSDVVLPHMGGREIADRLLTSHPTLKVLFLSGYSADVVASQGVLRPDFGFLQKPFNTAALAQKVRELLDRRT